MKQSDRRGVALAMVVIFAFVLSVLAGAVYTMFSANVQSHMWDRDRIQARYTAEAAENLSVKMIMGGADVPHGLTPRQFLPVLPATGWYDLPGDDLGQAIVWVDPSDHNPEVWTGDAYGIRALGRVADAEGNHSIYGMETAVVPENFCRFATFLNGSVFGGYYGDGYRFDGPFFCNGTVCLWSPSVSSTNDIWFYTFGLAADHYYYSTGSATNPATTPIYGNLTIQPTERMQMGAPYFELGADSIPFGSDHVNWQDCRDAALSGGLYFGVGSPYGTMPNNSRLILQEDTLLVKRTVGGAVTKYWLGGFANKVVWIDNNASDRIYIKSMPPYVSGDDPYCATGLSTELTIGMNGSVFIDGPLQYQNRDVQDPNNTILLGLLSVYGNFVLTNDPGPGELWPDPWKIVTDGDLELDATVMVLDGEYVAENAYAGPPGPADFLLMGGYIVQDEGLTTTPTTGWNTVIFFDPRLLSMHPPFFPQTGRWDQIFWAEKPDLAEDNIDAPWF